MNSKRLEQVYQFVDSCENFYDLCCDHGQLGRSILENKKAKYVFFNDQIDAILDKLSNKLIASDITTGYCLLKGPGQNIQFIEDSTISIVGVGYDTIINLLENISVNATLIISSHTKQFKLRDYLNNGHYRLIEDVLIEENGYIYNIMKLDTYTKGEIDLVGNFPKTDVYHKFLDKGFKYYNNKVKYCNYSLTKKILNKIIEKQKEFL